MEEEKKKKEKLVVLMPKYNFGYGARLYVAGEKYVMAKKDVPPLKGKFTVKTYKSKKK